MKRCENGHFYDETKNPTCPYCQQSRRTPQQPAGGHQMRQCENGHFYDVSKTPLCPYCQRAQENARALTEARANAARVPNAQRRPASPAQAPVSAPAPKPSPASAPVRKPAPASAPASVPERKPAPASAPAPSPVPAPASVPTPASPRSQETADNGRTVGRIRESVGIDPVVGYLVCSKGPHRGEDFRLRSGHNFICRSQKCGVALLKDDAVSQDIHAVVTFDPRRTNFFLSVGAENAVVTRNRMPIKTSVKLDAYDVIGVGKTELVFLPLCCDSFSWSAE